MKPEAAEVECRQFRHNRVVLTLGHGSSCSHETGDLMSPSSLCFNKPDEGNATPGYFFARNC